MGEMSLPCRDSVRSTSSQETAGEDSLRQHLVDGSMSVESTSQTKSQVEINQDIKPNVTSTKPSATTATVDHTRNMPRGKPSESSLDGSIMEVDQGLQARQEHEFTPTMVVDMPPDTQWASQVPSEQRSATPNDLPNGGSAVATTSGSPNPKQIVQQHGEKPPPAPIIQQNQKEAHDRPPAAPKQSDAPLPTQRPGSRFTVTPVTSVPSISAQAAIQQPADGQPFLAISRTNGTQQSVQSAPQQADSAKPNFSQPQKVPAATVTVGLTRNILCGRPSESSLGSIILEADQAIPPRQEHPSMPTTVVDIPSEKQVASQVPSEQRSVTSGDLLNGGSATAINLGSSNPKQVVQQQQHQQPPVTIASTTPGKPVAQQTHERPPAVPKQSDAPLSTQRPGSRFTVTPVTSVPSIPVQPGIQQPQERRPSLTASTKTNSTQQSVQSASQQAHSTQSNGSQPQHVPAATVDPTRNMPRGKPSESSLDSSLMEADQSMSQRQEQQSMPTVVVAMPPEKQSANQVPSEQRSVTSSDLSNAGSAAATNSGSPNPKQIVQQHGEKPPPAPIIQKHQQQPHDRPPAVPKHPDAPLSIQRPGSRFTVTPVTSVPSISAQAAIQQAQDRRPSQATSTRTNGTQQSVQSAPQQADSAKPSGSQPQHVPAETIAPLPPTPSSVPAKVPQPQVLKHRSVSVPCAPQPYPPEYQSQQKIGVARSRPDEQTETSQPALFYQIPGVIPLQTMSQSNGPVRQPQDQIIGMVGAIPIMKIQEGGVHYVKEQKGRFKLLHETAPAMVVPSPTVVPAPAVIPAPAVVTTPTESVPSLGTVTQPLVPPTSVATQSQESSPKVVPVPSVAAQVPGPSPALAATEQRTAATAALPPAANGNVTQFPETFDSSVPTIRKKGRFLVSNVKDLRNMIPTQKTTKPGVPVDVVSAQQSLQLPTMTQPAVAQPATQPVIAPITQQPVTQPVVPATIAVQHTNVEAVPASHPMNTVRVTQMSSSSPFFSLQGTAVITEPYAVNPPPACQQVDTQQQAQKTLSQRMTPVPLNSQSNTPPQTPATTGTPVTNESPRKPQPKPQVETPKVTEKTRVTQTIPPKKKVPLSARPAPHALDRGGKLSLGKLNYLLDQMKSEVTDADFLIRTLQTDLKLMRDKNKELEAKNLSLEKSLKEEKVLRERAEARNIELRKKMRETKIPPGSSGPKPQDQTVDASATTTNTKNNGSSGAMSKPSGAVPPPKPQRDSTAAPLASNLEKQSQQHPGILGNKGNRLGTNGVSMMPPKGLTSGSNSLGREQSRRTVGNGWHHRSNSLGNATDIFLQQVSADSMNSSPAKVNGGVEAKLKEESVKPTNANGSTPAQGNSLPQVVQKTPNVSDFDPLHQNQAAPSIANDVVPIMIPTQVSLVNATAPVFQNPSDPGSYQSNGNGMPTQYQHNQFVAENNIVVPITLGMAPAVDQTNMENGMQHQGINHNIRNLQQPSFMVFPQQQPFMVQQVPGRVQQGPNLIAGQLPQAVPSNQNAFSSYVPQMMQQQPQQPQSQLYYSTDSFDPLKK